MTILQKFHYFYEVFANFTSQQDFYICAIKILSKWIFNIKKSFDFS